MDNPAPAKGHPIGFWFFFWGEFAERCSYYGMRAILALYMTERLGVDEGDAGTFMSLFIAACYFFPLIGGWVADNFLGKYWTIVLFSVPYVIAQFCVGIENRYIVFAALVFLAMGSGVIKPNISTLMGMTYDQQRPGQTELRTSAFSWFYMAINIGAALSQFAMPWLQKNHGYQIAFLFPAGLMALALVIFGLGKRFYAKETITRKIVGDPSTQSKADSKTITGIPVYHKYCSQAEVDEDKRIKWAILSRIGLVFLTVMFFWAIFDQAASTWVFFANTYMDTTIIGERPAGGTMLVDGETCKSLTGDVNFSMGAAAIQGFNPLFIIIFVPISVAIFKVVKLKATTKIVIGYVLTSLSMVIMAFAGSLSGTKDDALKVTSRDGFMIIPLSEQKLEDMIKPGEEGSLNLKVKDGVSIVAKEAKHNKDNKKIEFKAGTITLKNGTTWTVEQGWYKDRKGLVDADKGLDRNATSPAGLLESSFKSDDAAKEMKRKPEEDKITVEKIGWVKPWERITVWWQIFAYLVLTIAEILISVTGLELAFVAAPQSMKSFVTACWLAVVFLANLLINAPITQLYPLMHPQVYFAMLAGAMVFVIAVFFPIAAKFNKTMSELPTQ